MNIYICIYMYISIYNNWVTIVIATLTFQFNELNNNMIIIYFLGILFRRERRMYYCSKNTITEIFEFHSRIRLNIDKARFSYMCTALKFNQSETKLQTFLSIANDTPSLSYE